MHGRIHILLLKLAILLMAYGAGSRLWALDAATMQAMVIVEGEEGRGSAFVVKIGDKTYLVTNSHVVRGNRNVKFKNLRNAEIPAGDMEIADAIDAVRMEIPATPHALELEPDMDKIKIGDEVIVAGNSEGEGVVREIRGKVVGIGPDRVEVDAEFVPGNSGSPILLKSTGKVIGLATYMKFSVGAWFGGRKNPFSLGEVRRFGYRLDTVEKWIHPSAKDRLAVEGLKLAEMENFMATMGRIVGGGANLLMKMGSSGFVTKEESKESPAFGALATAIDEFVKAQTEAKADEEKTKNVTSFFDKIRAVAGDDVKGMKEDQFNGYYALQLKESLTEMQRFFDWFDGTGMPAYREEWLKSRTGSLLGMINKPSLPPVDPAKLKLVLSDRIDPSQTPDNCHHVGYPPETKPDNLENLFWVIEQPQGDRRSIQMRRANVRVPTPVNGTYRVYVEFHSANVTRAVSNVIEVKFEGLAAAPSPGVSKENAKPGDFVRQPPAMLGPGKNLLLAQENIAHWEHATGQWKIEDGALTGRGDSSTSFRATLSAPFTLDFKIKVLDGMRPRVKIGSVTCGNEGYATTLALYPPGRDAGLFTYERNHDYEVSIKVTKDKMELYIDNHLISTGAGIDGSIDKLEFHGGDWWSKGATEYRDITVTK